MSEGQWRHYKTGELLRHACCNACEEAESEVHCVHADNIRCKEAAARELSSDVAHVCCHMVCCLFTDEACAISWDDPDNHCDHDQGRRDLLQDESAS